MFFCQYVKRTWIVQGHLCCIFILDYKTWIIIFFNITSRTAQENTTTGDTTPSDDIYVLNLFLAKFPDRNI